MTELPSRASTHETTSDANPFTNTETVSDRDISRAIIMADINKLTIRQPSGLAPYEIASLVEYGYELGRSEEYAATMQQPTYDTDTAGTPDSQVAKRERLWTQAAYTALNYSRAQGPFHNLPAAQVAVNYAADYAYAERQAEFPDAA